MTPAADVLARTIYGEARGEGLRGMQAVANVVMNRVAKPGWWGDTVASVCLKPRQFSCWNSNDPNLPVIQTVTQDDPQFVEACGIAQRVVTGTMADLTGGATHYKETRLVWPLSWGKPVPAVMVIGNHSFYNLT